MSAPAAVYRNAIDLNRYSNGVARRIIRSYNDVILDAVEQLRAIEEEILLTGEVRQPLRRARLRTLLLQLRESLATWSGSSAALMAEELQGLAVLQSGFAVEQLRQVLPDGSNRVVRTVEISPSFAQAVVTSDPTAVGIVDLSDRLERLAPDTVTFQLTAGQQLTLPNGSVVRQAFDRMSTRQAEVFSQVLRVGLLEGKSVGSIVSQLKGRLQREQAGTVDSIIASGGQVTAMPNNQIRAIVRTSVNQVVDAAEELVALQNPDITKKYRYTALLDSKTTPICRALDGKVYEWGKGPKPPQHFGCRSRRVSLTTGFAARTLSLREPYGIWFDQQTDLVKEDVLGPKRIPYYNALVKKYGKEDAIRKFVDTDGTELTLKQLADRYPNVATSK
jgi:SPP1 gp7 family putative phage head morphogenesis protein